MGVNCKFSVAIPAYKATYFRECIDSVLAQTYTDFELIIVNDASPEDLDSIVSLYDDKRIRYYKNEKNCGAINVVDNWNKCLEYATGDYMICMGDDDKLLPDCLYSYSELINKYPNLDVFHGWTELIDEKSKLKDMTPPRPEFESVYSLIYFRWRGRLQYIGDFLFRTDALKKAGGFYKLPYAWCSDDITAVRAASPKGIANTQKIVFQYRVNSLTISKSGDETTKFEALYLAEKWFTNFLNENIVDSELDRKLLGLIQYEKKLYFRRRYSTTICKDVKNRNTLRLLYWIKKKDDFGFTMSVIYRALYLYTKSLLKRLM